MIELYIYGTDLDSHTADAIEKYGTQVTIRHFGRLERDPSLEKADASTRKNAYGRCKTGFAGGVEAFLKKNTFRQNCMNILDEASHSRFGINRNPSTFRLLVEWVIPVQADDVTALTEALKAPTCNGNRLGCRIFSRTVLIRLLTRAKATGFANSLAGDGYW